MKKYAILTVAAFALMMAGPVLAAEPHSGFGTELFTNESPVALSDEADAEISVDNVAATDAAAAEAATIEPAAGDAQQDSEKGENAQAVETTEEDNGIYTGAPIPENKFDGSWQRNSNEFIFGP